MIIFSGVALRASQQALEKNPFFQDSDLSS